MTSPTDKERLRTLAGRYAEITNSDEMNRRRETWRLSNRLEKRTVPYVIEDNGTYFDTLVPGLLQCEGKLERRWERQMVRAIQNFELIPDDRVWPNYFNMEWAISRPSMCPEYKATHADEGQGRNLGYTTNKPLADLPNALSKLQRGEFSVDREGTLARAEQAREIFGDLLPVKIMNRSIVWAGAGMASSAVNWIGMENLFTLMMDEPGSVKAFFNFVATERCDFFDWMKAEGLLKPTSGEICVGSGSIGYTDELPRDGVADEDLDFADLWGFQESQEATGISPAMFKEFIFPAQKKVSERFGLVYYGCCEPVHNLYPVIKGLTNVRKITVSPWCDQNSIAEQVGKNVVMSRKPHPMKLCAPAWDPDEFRGHILETLTAAKDCFVEIIFRDTCTLSFDMKDRVVEACGIVRNLIDEGN